MCVSMQNKLVVCCRTYCAATVTYSCVRKCYLLKGSKVKKFNWTEARWKKVDLLLSSKIAIIAVAALSAPGLFPYWLCKDLSYLEFYMCNINPYDYDIRPPEYESDYYFI